MLNGKGGGTTCDLPDWASIGSGVVRNWERCVDPLPGRWSRWNRDRVYDPRVRACGSRPSRY